MLHMVTCYDDFNFFELSRNFELPYKKVALSLCHLQCLNAKYKIDHFSLGTYQLNLVPRIDAEINYL